MSTTRSATAALVKAQSRTAALNPWLDRWSLGRRGLAETLRLWVHRSGSRRRLAELNDRELADIGLSRGQAHFESEKPFWLS
jgi:uncharacterized protein YjiS (DUF1127 family)